MTRKKLERVTLTFPVALSDGKMRTTFERADYIPEWGVVVLIDDNECILIPQDHVLRMVIKVLA